MLNDYSDIRSRIKEDPLWFDMSGCPRFDKHHPNMSPDIYAKEACLLLISCQACYEEFNVQLSSGLEDECDYVLRATSDLGKTNRADISKGGLLRFQVENGTIHYGDPPRHKNKGWANPGGFDCSGCTMNVYDLKVLEFWKRDKSDWIRVPELEIELEGLPET